VKDFTAIIDFHAVFARNALWDFVKHPQVAAAPIENGGGMAAAASAIITAKLQKNRPGCG